MIAGSASPELPINLVCRTRKNLTAGLRGFLDFTADLSFHCL